MIELLIFLFTANIAYVQATPLTKCNLTQELYKQGLFKNNINLFVDNEIPTNPGDNSHYVDGRSRYIWMPDGNGTPLLVDLAEPVDEELLSIWNGTSNQYWLYTRLKTNHVITQMSFLCVNDPNQHLKVIVHDWNGDGNSLMNPLITNAFLTVMECNVIVVNWKDVSSLPYNTACAGVPSAGEHLGNFLIWLINTTSGDWDKVHLVGTGLGAHVVGNAGVQAKGSINRVSGLDPSGPGWRRNKRSLSRSSGQFVDATHTDVNGIGSIDISGGADFYPNGGKNPQPSCWLSTCSHQHASSIFASAVIHNHLVGRKCKNLEEAHQSRCKGGLLHMGNSHVKNGTGIFHVTTTHKWPY